MHDSFFDIPQLSIVIALSPTVILGALIYGRLSFFWRIVHLQLVLAFVCELVGRSLVLDDAKNTIPIFNCYLLAEQLLLLSAVFIALKPRMIWCISSLTLWPIGLVVECL